VAASLGHHSFAVTRKHYAQTEAIANAGTARFIGVLEGSLSEAGNRSAIAPKAVSKMGSATEKRPADLKPHKDPTERN